MRTVDMSTAMSRTSVTPIKMKPSWVRLKWMAKPPSGGLSANVDSVTEFINHSLLLQDDCTLRLILNRDLLL